MVTMKGCCWSRITKTQRLVASLAGGQILLQIIAAGQAIRILYLVGKFLQFSWCGLGTLQRNDQQLQVQFSQQEDELKNYQPQTSSFPPTHCHGKGLHDINILTFLLDISVQKKISPLFPVMRELSLQWKRKVQVSVFHHLQYLIYFQEKSWNHQDHPSFCGYITTKKDCDVFPSESSSICLLSCRQSRNPTCKPRDLLGSDNNSQ